MATSREELVRPAEGFVVQKACRICGGAWADRRLEFGDIRVSDFPWKGAPLPPKVPLNLVECEDCGVVQLDATYSRDALYRSQYWYRSGTNEMMRAALRDVVEHALVFVRLDAHTPVLDIGCNDGTLLDFYPDFLDRHGIEPSELATEARARGHHVQRRMWDSGAYVPEFYRIITSIAMFYSVADPVAFISNVRQALHPDGVWIVQLQDMEGMARSKGFDNICHEHIFYYEAADIERLAARFGLFCVSRSRNQTNGGSVRLVFRKGSRLMDPLPERSWPTVVERVPGQIAAIKRAVAPANLWGYGASTKGNTLLQVCGIDGLPGVAERAEEKIGRMTANGIPIVSEAEAREKADAFFVLPWHFIDGILDREREFLRQGKSIIVPLPDVRTYSHRG